MARRADRLFWGVVGASGFVALLTVIAIRLSPTSPPPAMRGPALPRMRGPVGDVPTGDMLRSIGVGSLTWYASILSAPLFIWLSRRMPFDRRRWAISLAVHLGAVVALVAITGLVQYQLTYAGFPGAPTAWRYLQVTLLTGSLPFMTIAAGAHALEARMRARDGEVEAARARSQLAEARLEALSAQLQPHFLFNTLQAISTLIPRDPAGAEQMLAHLADLLRDVLRNSERRELPLREELQVLESYLAISRRRFGDRLTVRIDAPPDTLDVPVPFFILQPLVENALHHGVGSNSGPAEIAIVARRKGARLSLEVVDNGPGARRDDIRPGIGLNNTAARLRELYGERSSLDFGSGPQGGFHVRLTLPQPA